MATVVVGTLGIDEFPLARTLDGDPDVEFEFERVTTEGKSVAALAWAYGPPPSGVEGLLDADPSVRERTRMATLEDAVLFQLELVRDLSFLRYVLGEAKATVLDAYGTPRGWRLCLTYPDYANVRSTESFCESRGLSFDVSQVSSVSESPLDRHGLSERQYEALTVAWRLGYFDVPRRADLEAVATELDISHQAASERLRRGHETLVSELVGATVREELRDG